MRPVITVQQAVDMAAEAVRVASESSPDVRYVAAPAIAAEIAFGANGKRGAVIVRKDAMPIFRRVTSTGFNFASRVYAEDVDKAEWLDAVRKIYADVISFLSEPPTGAPTMNTTARAPLPAWALAEIIRRSEGFPDPNKVAAAALEALRPALRLADALGGDAQRVLIEGCIEELLPTGPVFRGEFGETLD